MTEAELRAKYPNRAEWFYVQMLEAHNAPRRQPASQALTPRPEVSPPAVSTPTPPLKRKETGKAPIFAEFKKHERLNQYVAYVPILIKSEANDQGRHIWRAKMLRIKRQRQAVELYLWDLKRRAKPESVFLFRHGRPLDGDNLQNSFKHVRDTIAELLEFDDRDPEVSWTYDQTFEGVVGFTVVIVWPPGVCPCCGRPITTET